MEGEKLKTKRIVERPWESKREAEGEKKKSIKKPYWRLGVERKEPGIEKVKLIKKSSEEGERRLRL